MDWHSLATSVCSAVGAGDLAKVSKKEVKIRNKAVNVVQAVSLVCGGSLGAYNVLALKDKIALVCLAQYVLPQPHLSAACLAYDVISLAINAGNNLVAACERDENPKDCLMELNNSYKTSWKKYL